jgi:UPF0755 protein
MSRLGLDMGTHDPRTIRRRSRLFGIGALLVIIVVVVGIIGGAGLVAKRLFVRPGDYPGPGTGQVVVVVKPGQTTTQIGVALHQASVVKSVEAFTKAAAADTRSTGLQPGSYRLRKHMRAKDALAAMFVPANRVGRVMVPEGSRLDRTLGLIAAAGSIKRADLAAVAARPAALGLPPAAKGAVEGFLFPAAYDIQPDATATSVLTAMVRRFDQAAGDVDLAAGAKALGVSERAVVIVASIIQAESAAPADDTKVARVIYNRLAKGMRLQLDSTVNYALDHSKPKLSLDDIKVKSPYNTYLHDGLPPGPIDSPGEAALRAALHPAAGNWIFFITNDKQVTKFTADYQEFLRYKAEFQAHQ